MSDLTENHRQVIYIATTPGRVDMLYNCLRRFKDLNYDGKYPIFVESCYHYDWFDFARHHDCDEIMFLHDSVQMMDISFFDLVFETYKGKSVSIGGPPYFLMGLGKFLRKPYLKTADLFPQPHDAYMGYKDVEFNFGPKYCEIAKETPIVIDPDFMKCETRGHKKEREFRRKFGRMNLVLRNKYMIKYKAHWNRSMLGYADKDGYIHVNEKGIPIPPPV
jgi:hypothetical protein